jgi:hypothetical protein
MARSALLGSASTFAHLLGRAPKARAEDDRDEDDKKPKDSKKAADDSDEDDDKDKDAKSSRAEDKKDDDDDKDKDAKSSRADDDDEDMSAEEDDEDEDDKKDKGDAKASAARRRERARCAAIFGTKAAGARPDVAAHLAFESNMGRRAACSLLKTLAAGQASVKGLSARMEGMQNVGPGQDRASAPTGRQALNASWDAAAKRAGVNKPDATAKR